MGKPTTGIETIQPDDITQEKTNALVVKKINKSVALVMSFFIMNS